jgi:phosphoglucomutase
VTPQQSARDFRKSNQRECQYRRLNPKVDRTFPFMTVDHDGQIRIDCSCAYAKRLLASSGSRQACSTARTKDIYRICAKSFQDQAHLDSVVSEAQDIVSHALKRE